MAQVYQWVDAEGKVHFTDQPPPPTAKSVQKRKVAAGASGDDGLPYAVREAARNFPVTLYVNDCGETCTRARALLTGRGVPFVERDPREPTEEEALKKLTGGIVEIPILKIGNTILRGFAENQWHSELDIVGYPRTAPPARPRLSAPAKAPAVAIEPEVLQKSPVTLYNSVAATCATGRATVAGSGHTVYGKGCAGASRVEELRAHRPGQGNHSLANRRMALGGFDAARWNSTLDSAGYPKAP